VVLRSRILQVLLDMPASGLVILVLSLLPIIWPFVVSFGLMKPDSNDNAGCQENLCCCV
jgi:hypothetical protein